MSGIIHILSAQIQVNDFRNKIADLFLQYKDQIETMANWIAFDKAEEIGKQVVLSKYLENKNKISKSDLSREIELTAESINKKFDEWVVARANFILEEQKNAKAKKQKALKKEFQTWLSKQFVLDVNLSRDSHKDMSKLYKTFIQLHPEIPIATLKTWNNRRHK